MNSFSCFKLKAWTFCSFFERMTENINSILGQVLRICKNFCLLPIIINIFFCLCRCSCIFFKKMFCHFAVTNNLIARTANLVIYLLHFASPFSTITIQRFSLKHASQTYGLKASFCSTLAVYNASHCLAYVTHRGVALSCRRCSVLAAV